jgi:hypothetical protein
MTCGPWALKSAARSPSTGTARPGASCPSPTPLPTSKGNNFLTAVTALSSGDLWTFGGTLDFTLGGLEKTVTLQWNGTQWVVVDSSNQGRQNNLLLGVDSPGGGLVIAVGTFRTGPMGINRTLAMEKTQG